MKIKRTKIKAFTITEMLTVLTISSIVATLAFSILSMVGGNLSAIQKNYELNSSRSLIQQQLTIDFNNYHDIRFDGLERQLIATNPLDSVVYSFSEEAVLRNRDTILHNAYDLQLYYQGNIVVSNYVDAIKLSLSTEQNQSLFVSKRNDASQKVKNHGN